LPDSASGVVVNISKPKVLSARGALSSAPFCIVNARYRLGCLNSIYGTDTKFTKPRMTPADAFTLFRRLGVNVATMNKSEFTLVYFGLAKRYHPDRNPHGAELMANINAARATILNWYRKR